MKNAKIFSIKDVLPSLEYIININLLLNNLTYRLRDTIYTNNRDKNYPHFEISIHPSGDILFILVGLAKDYPRDNVIIGRLKPNLNTLKYTLIVEKDAESFNFNGLADIANNYVDLLNDCIIDTHADNAMLNIRKIVEHAYLYILLNNIINNLYNKLSDVIATSNDTFEFFGVFTNILFKEDKILINVKIGQPAYKTEHPCLFHDTFICTPLLKNSIEYIVELQANEAQTIRPTIEEKMCTAVVIKNVLGNFIKNVDKCLNGDSPALVLIENTIDKDQSNITWTSF